MFASEVIINVLNFTQKMCDINNSLMKLLIRLFSSSPVPSYFPKFSKCLYVESAHILKRKYNASWAWRFLMNMYYWLINWKLSVKKNARESSVGTETRYGLDCLGIDSRWVGGRYFPRLSRPALGPTQPLIHEYQVFTTYSRRWRKSRAIPLLPPGPPMPVLGWTLPLPLPLQTK
jgi:hypothetical protein